MRPIGSERESLPSLKDNELDFYEASPQNISEDDFVTIYEDIFDVQPEAMNSPNTMHSPKTMNLPNTMHSPKTMNPPNTIDSVKTLHSSISSDVENKTPMPFSFKLNNNVVKSTDFSSKSYSRSFGHITRYSKSKSKLGDIILATEQMISNKSKAALRNNKENKNFGARSFARNMDSFREHASR